MGIRETLRGNSKVGAGLGVAAIVLAVALIAMQLRGGGASGNAYFTTDDGTTLFTDDALRPVPFQRDGKEAVRAYVFECNGTRFVNHLERYTPERQELMRRAEEAAKAGQPPPEPPPAARQAAMWGVEIKKPGDKEWVPAGNFARSSPIMQAKCPDGGEPIPVEP